MVVPPSYSFVIFENGGLKTILSSATHDPNPGRTRKHCSIRPVWWITSPRVGTGEACAEDDGGDVASALNFGGGRRHLHRDRG
jgi:hypothetical protein